MYLQKIVFIMKVSYLMYSLYLLPNSIPSVIV
jgi:hypothetical protein